jgi:hypothetical protein
MSAPVPTPAPQQPARKYDNRVIWVITGYTAAFVSLLAVLVYYWQQLPQ